MPTDITLAVTPSIPLPETAGKQHNPVSLRRLHVNIKSACVENVQVKFLFITV